MVWTGGPLDLLKTNWLIYINLNLHFYPIWWKNAKFSSAVTVKKTACLIAAVLFHLYHWKETKEVCGYNNNFWASNLHAENGMLTPLTLAG